MHTRFQVTLLAIAVAFAGGCDRKSQVTAPGGASNATPFPGHLAVSAQLEAALAIQNPIQRDDALSAVAQTAAEGGDGTVAMAAVVAIMNPQLKDDTAVLAAKGLANAGKGSEATGIAKIILNPILRDETLLDLSKL